MLLDPPPDEDEPLVKSATIWKWSAFVALGITAEIAFSVWRNWARIRPTTESTIWMAVDATADAVGALGALTVAAIAFRGLRSLRLTRDDINARVDRDAVACAIQQCEVFARSLLGRRFNDALVTSAIPPFVKQPADVQFDPDSTDHLPKAKALVSALDPKLRNAAIVLMNDIEAWSMYFTSGLANARVAYGPCATPFMSLVVKLYPLLVVYRQHALSGQFPNTVHLFNSWRDKKDVDGKRAELGQVLERMRELDAKQMDPSRPKLPGTIGKIVD